MPSLHQDLTRTTLAVLFIGGLIAATLWVLLPFLPAIVWAMTLVVSTWPLMLRVQHFAGNHRSLAVLAMTAALLLIVILPLWLAIATVVANIDEIAELSRAAVASLTSASRVAGESAVGRAARCASLATTRSSRRERLGAEARTICRVYDAMVRGRSWRSRIVVSAVSSNRGYHRNLVRSG